MDHRLRRDRLAARLEDLKVDAVLITKLVNVRYLTGFTGSNGQLLLSPEDAVFLTDFRYEEQSSHEVPDIERVVYRAAFREAFGPACALLSTARVGFEAYDLTYQVYRELDEAAEDVELVPIGPEVERLRWAKDPEELALLGRAQEITDQGFREILESLAPGLTERQLAVELELAMRRAGADRLAFDTIAAFGENAAEPHHRPTDRALARGDVVKLDFGCVVDGYHSDMTRTVALGEPDPRIREIYDVVHAAQAAGEAAVRAGVEGKVPDLAARAVIEAAGYGERFGHSLGHGVGLEIHEGPTLRAVSEDILPEGAVVTVEPGIYLPGVGGVRIEDMVVVTAEGSEAMPATSRELLVL